MKISGLILAGGLSRRMGGAAKGLLPWRGQALVAHVIERFIPQVNDLFISANAPGYEDFDCPVIADVFPGHAGPLAGLHAGLSHAVTPLLATVPCDAPLLPHDLVARLAAALGDAPAAVAQVNRDMQPTFLLCRRELAPELARHLASGERRMGAWLDHVGARRVDFSDVHAFTNINTPEDLMA